MAENIAENALLRSLIVSEVSSAALTAAVPFRRLALNSRTAHEHVLRPDTVWKFRSACDQQTAGVIYADTGTREHERGDSCKNTAALICLPEKTLTGRQLSGSAGEGGLGLRFHAFIGLRCV